VKAQIGWLQRHVGRRGAFLLWLAVLDLVYAYSLLSPPPSAMTNALTVYLASICPLAVLGVAWGAVGLICVVTAFLRADRLGFAAAICIKCVWTSLFIIGCFAGVERAYLSAAIWGTLAALVWIVVGWPEKAQS
jgi:hypothetical protein